MPSSIQFFDSTLRDGSHAVAHQLTVEQITTYCQQIDSAGMYVVTVGHGNGLGASSLQVGRSQTTDMEMIGAARAALTQTKLGVFLLPGFGTIKDDLEPALQAGVDIVSVAAHCTEADVTAQHIQYILNQQKEAYGVLMNYHMTSTDRLVQEAQKMQSYGVRGVLLMDSAGASTPRLVKETIVALVDQLEIPIGFHAHNNLSMAVANTLVAVQAGARIVDGTMRGFGAGAGNCQLEALAALLQKVGVPVSVDLYRMLDVSDNVVATMLMKKPQEVDAVSVVSGLSGVFSGFKVHVLRAAKEFGVDPRDIFMELGKRKVVGGQEDVVVEVAMELRKRKT